MIASVIRPKRMILPSRTCIDGVRSAESRTRRSRKSLTAAAAHNVTSSRIVVLSNNRGVSLMPPRLSDTESSTADTGSSNPRMLSAARVQAVIVTTR